MGMVGMVFVEHYPISEKYFYECTYSNWYLFCMVSSVDVLLNITSNYNFGYL